MDKDEFLSSLLGEPMMPVSKVRDEFEKILAMKREPNEATDTYALNRCWHIANDFLNTLPEPPSTNNDKLK